MLPPDLFTALRSLELPAGDFAVFGSGPLIIRGIIEATNDLDVVSRGPAWELARTRGEPMTLGDGAVVAGFYGGAITVGTSWSYGEVDIDQLIETAEVIDDLPFVRLEHVVAYKRIAARPKDVEHLRLMEEAGLI